MTIILPVVILVGCIIAPFPTLADDAGVAAAASLTYAMRELSDRFQRTGSHRIRLTFGSSRNLMRQIIQGAPFELFLSADKVSVERLAARSLTQGDGVVYALGRLAVFKPNRSEVRLTADLTFIEKAVEEKRLQRLAIANPETAPYGAIAVEALRKAGVWEFVKPYVVTGENALQAAQYGLSGSADAAIFPLAIASIPVFARRGVFLPVADALYRPLKQKMVLLKNSSEAARAFYQYLQSSEAQSILTSHGFGQQEQSDSHAPAE